MKRVFLVQIPEKTDIFMVCTVDIKIKIVYNPYQYFRKDGI